jgi:hypothetical protein
VECWIVGVLKCLQHSITPILPLHQNENPLESIR